MMGFLHPSVFGNKERAQSLWLHALAVAEAASLMAREQDRVKADQAFAAGLLHDIGKVVSEAYFHNEVNALRELVEERRVPYQEAEKSLEIEHDKMGLLLGRNWKLPPVLNEAIGRHHRLGADRLRCQKDKRYAFMVGFVEPAAERNFTLANRNNASSPREPAMVDGLDTYPRGWGLRREGNGKNPPLKIPGEQPPPNPAVRRQLQAESAFPHGPARYAIPPTCEGYPDVDTYRDHEFYIIAQPEE